MSRQSPFAKKVAREQSCADNHRRRNPGTTDALLGWLHRQPHVVGRLIEINADLRRMFGDDARLELHAMTPAPYVARFGGYVPDGVYYDLWVTLDGGRTGVGRSIFLEVHDNKLMAPRLGLEFDADNPTGPESRRFLDEIETGIARLLRHERQPTKYH